jgi:hypothetical protein
MRHLPQNFTPITEIAPRPNLSCPLANLLTARSPLERARAPDEHEHKHEYEHEHEHTANTP